MTRDPGPLRCVLHGRVGTPLPKVTVTSLGSNLRVFRRLEMMGLPSLRGQVPDVHTERVPDWRDRGSCPDLRLF